MTDFPRTVLPFRVTDLDLPGPLISKSQGGRLNIRGTQQIGRSWQETYRLNTQLTAHKGFLAQVRNLWRNGLSFDIAHVDYLAAKGALGGSPLVNAAPQLVTQPENFGAWTVTGTPILTSGQTDPFGGTAAYLIEDDAAGTAEDVHLTITFTGNATKACAIFVKAGTATATDIRLNGASLRAQLHLAWSAGVPTASINSGSGIAFTPELYAPGWYRCAFTADGVVAADTNQLFIYPSSATAANTGTVYVFGANAWNTTAPARYSGPSATGDEPTGNLLHMDGGTASVSNYFRAGDQISVPVGSRIAVHEVTADVSTQANGYAAVPINPPLFSGSAPVDNAAITVSGVKMRACLVAPPTWPETTAQDANYGDLTLSFAETL